MARHHSSKKKHRQRPRSLRRRILLAASATTLIISGLVGFLGAFAGLLLLNPSGAVAYEVVDTNRPLYAGSPLGPDAAASPLSSAFTSEVQYWSPLIKAWAVMHQVDPNLIATVIQIESCGDPQVASPAGAQGLFQVMPFHFSEEEDMLDVQTNARRGLEYLIAGLEKADGHAGLALAGYNGGHGIINKGWAAWTAETRRYYYWGARIYSEAVSGMVTSPTLVEWLERGGTNLCARARESQEALEEEQARLATMITD
jgi:hypothetical protein